MDSVWVIETSMMINEDISDPSLILYLGSWPHTTLVWNERGDNISISRMHRYHTSKPQPEVLIRKVTDHGTHIRDVVPNS